MANQRESERSVSETSLPRAATETAAERLLSRRLALQLTGSLAASWCLPGLLRADEPAAATAAESDTPRRYELRLEAVGTLELDPSGQAPVSAPFRVVGTFDYVQRIDRETDRVWAARKYSKAEAAITVGKGSTLSSLSELQRVVVESHRRRDERQVELRIDRVGQPLTSDELELVRLPLVSPAAASWFESAGTRTLTESWTPESWAVASCLAIDVVTENKIVLRIRKREAGVLLVEVRGSVSGTAGDVATEIQLLGTVNLREGSPLPVSATWDIQEQRTLGPATPGFAARTKLQLDERGAADWSAADETQFQQIRAAAGDLAPDRLVFESKHHGFRLAHSTKWRPIADNSQAVILRLVDQADLIAQAHVTRLQSLAAGTKLTSERYRKDVSEAIGEQGGQIVDVSDFVTNQGYDGIRVVVSAEVSGVAIQWIYLHVADTRGRRCGWVFTVEQDRLDRFGIEDQNLLDDFELLDAPEPPAEPAEAPAGPRAAARPGTPADR